MPESNHTCADLGIPYMDTQRNLICAKARESLAFQVTVNENFGLAARRTMPPAWGNEAWVTEWRSADVAGASHRCVTAASA
jgi:hypothetical protein